jgi:hypothetical protein
MLDANQMTALEQLDLDVWERLGILHSFFVISDDIILCT